MNAKIISALSLMALTATAAQAQQVSDRVAKAMPTAYQEAECELEKGHFKVSSGATYLKSGIEADLAENKARVFEDGERVLTEAIQKNGQAKNGAAWYYLGRIYLHQGDLAGADSALSRAQQLAPQCAKDIQTQRRNAWVAVLRAGNTFEEQKNADSALAMYRQATMVLPSSPVSHYYVATILNDKGQTDSAAVHFSRAAMAEGAVDTAEVKYRNRSAFNAGALHLTAKRYPQAVQAFERYLKWEPNDVEAKRGLATAYRGAGQTEKAQVLEQQLIASGDAGSAGGAAGGAGAQDLMSVGVNLYNDKKYAEAAAAFEKVVAAEPHNRDALFNLTNTYFAMKDGPKLLATAQKLAALEPLNETTLKLVGEGYKQTNKVDDAVKTAEKVLALPVDVKVTDFSATGSGGTWSATATGRLAQTPAGKPIPPAPMTVVIEFLDAKGAVVATQEAQVPALKAGATHEIKAAGQGSGITAWRYKRK